MHSAVLLVFDILCLCAALYFMLESIREREPRAPYFGLGGAVFHLLLVPVIIWVPILRVPIAILFCLYVLAFIVFLIPGRRNPRALKGSMGHVVGEVRRFDERDTVFARIEGLQSHPEIAQFQDYYQRHPEFKDYDDKRKDGGFPVGPPGTIDHYYAPTKAMTEANWNMCLCKPRT